MDEEDYSLEEAYENGMKAACKIIRQEVLAVKSTAFGGASRSALDQVLRIIDRVESLRLQ